MKPETATLQPYLYCGVEHEEFVNYSITWWVSRAVAWTLSVSRILPMRRLQIYLHVLPHDNIAHDPQLLCANPIIATSACSVPCGGCKHS
eukprot:1433541-Amphidinium_carterae.1